MSCEDCTQMQRDCNIQAGVGSYYFRWKNANIELRGCREHVKQVMEALRVAQEATRIGTHGA